MTRNEIDMETFMKVKARVDAMTDGELINWLGNNINTLYPEIFINRLPSGLSYISGPMAFNCIDFATGCRGNFWLKKQDQVETDQSEGALISYQYNEKILHLGILIEGGGKVISQWGQKASVFQHHINQIPANFKGNTIKYYKAPV